MFKFKSCYLASVFLFLSCGGRTQDYSVKESEVEILSHEVLKFPKEQIFEGAFSSRAKILNVTLEPDGNLSLFGMPGFETEEDLAPYLGFLKKLFQSVDGKAAVAEESSFGSGHLFGYRGDLKTTEAPIDTSKFNFSSTNGFSLAVQKASSEIDSLQFKVTIDSFDLVVRKRPFLFGFPGYDKPALACEVVMIPNSTVRFENIDLLQGLIFHATNPTFGLISRARLSNDPLCEKALQLAKGLSFNPEVID